MPAAARRKKARAKGGEPKEAPKEEPKKEDAKADPLAEVKWPAEKAGSDAKIAKDVRASSGATTPGC